ncbi:hypothetical protein J4Q44_G00185520 [Coregonus suidteri]|uniref:Uncharacterized protein n=1 Tax=Coregonus suidteri TaxID=861788 RepID=A0AAN8LLE9_9TELE
MASCSTWSSSLISNSCTSSSFRPATSSIFSLNILIAPEQQSYDGGDEGRLCVYTPLHQTLTDVGQVVQLHTERHRDNVRTTLNRNRGHISQ